MTPGELNSKLAYWRHKQATEGLSTEEMIEVVEALAAGRVSAQIASTTSRTTKAVVKAANGPVAQSTLDDIFGALS
jgi:DNA-binding NarL/FixJ family response regulator